MLDEPLSTVTLADTQAIVIGEIGGGNALGPMITALQCGVPVVDGDGMGRYFGYDVDYVPVEERYG